MSLLAAAALLLLSTGLAGSMPGGPGVPENITVTFLNPTSVKVSWATSVINVDKYDVTYKPTDASYRVVAVVAGNSDAVTLSGLKADTQYQLTVAAVWGGKKYRSRPIVFRTLEPPRSSPHQQDHPMMGTLPTDNPATAVTKDDPEPVDLPEYTYPQTSSTVRGVEIGIVLLVLLVWVGAIALFFNRWGKIRMLLPYQPDYKQEQLKVPGTAACAAAVASGNTCTHHSGDHVCQQCCCEETEEARSLPIIDIINCTNPTCGGGSSIAVGVVSGGSGAASSSIYQQPPRKPRPRINSAIFVSNSGPGFDSKEFFRRHGSVSRLCRKARSVDNMSMEDDDEERHFGLPVLSISGPSPPEDDESQNRDDRDDGGETQRFLE